MTPESERVAVLPEIRDMEGPAALPRVNGDLVFESPWQGRAFGTAIATTRHLDLDWDEFRLCLITAIANQPDRPYYESWIEALERLVVDRGLITAQDIENRSAEITE